MQEFCGASALAEGGGSRISMESVQVFSTGSSKDTRILYQETCYYFQLI